MNNKQHHNKGDLHAQRKRRRKRAKEQRHKTEHEYQTIDGNWTSHPVSYCTRYHGVLTQGLIDTHGCTKRDCVRLKECDFE